MNEAREPTEPGWYWATGIRPNDIREVVLVSRHVAGHLHVHQAGWGVPYPINQWKDFVGPITEAGREAAKGAG